MYSVRFALPALIAALFASLCFAPPAEAQPDWLDGFDAEIEQVMDVTPRVIDWFDEHLGRSSGQ